jgi:hypothetical protein
LTVDAQAAGVGFCNQLIKIFNCAAGLLLSRVANQNRRKLTWVTDERKCWRDTLVAVGGFKLGESQLND